MYKFGAAGLACTVLMQASKYLYEYKYPLCSEKGCVPQKKRRGGVIIFVSTPASVSFSYWRLYFKKMTDWLTHKVIKIMFYLLRAGY